MKIVWHEHPDQVVAKKCRYLEEVRKKDGSSAYWQLVKHELKTDPWFLMRVALEWAWLDEDLVGCKLIRHLADNWGEDVGIMFPRGHGKTLPVQGMLISAILNKPNIAILEVSRTEDNAKKFGSTLADHLMYNDYLQRCFGTKYNSDGILPASIAECSSWGKDGYNLPRRKPRNDPTLYCIPLAGAKAGKHPDIIYVDDPTEEENNDEAGWEHVTQAVMGMWMMLPAHGFYIWTGTRWHDSDPLGRAVAGKLTGKQGPFKFIQSSCYIDDMPEKGPVYAHKVRWNMTEPSGYTLEMLEAKRKSKEEGGFGEFFDAQMRNDPAPADRADIKIKDINIYNEGEHPKLSDIKLVGIETTGGGLPIYNGLLEYCEKMRLPLPLEEIVNPRRVGTTKRDRIVAALQPITSSGRLWVQEWMIGAPESRDTLGYELRRIGKAAHDDIADALHNVPAHLTNNIIPSDPSEPAHLYISVDLAYSEEKRSDWSVVMAVAVDHKANYWVLDYKRQRISNPSGLYEFIVQFCRKFEEPENIKRKSNRKYPGAWR